jgi:hypothetical protein
MTDTQCLIGAFYPLFFPQRRKNRSVLPFINRETLSLSTLFTYLERFTRESNKKTSAKNSFKKAQTYALLEKLGLKANLRGGKKLWSQWWEHRAISSLQSKT